MKEITINPNNILDSDITDIKNESYYIFKCNDKLLLKSHHNSFYFIHDTDLNKKYDKEPFMIKKEYIEDYPYIGEKLLIIKKYFIIEENVDIPDAIWLESNSIIDYLNEQKYLNPRMQNNTNEIIETLKILLNK